jgi:TRAP-type transport system periplasmic protein
MKMLNLLGSLALALALAAPASAEIVLKAGHISPKNSPEGIAADRFAELVKEKTKGEVVIQVFPSEQLGPATAMIESTMLGNQDIYIGGNVEFERFSPPLKAVGLNYAIPSEAQFRKVLASNVWKDIFIDPLAKIGLTVVASDWERGPGRVLISKKPIRSFDDIKGLKLRIAPIDSMRISWQAHGAQTVVLAWNDVYLGLQQGLVDAVTSPINLFGPMKFTEVAKYVARTDEIWQVLAVVMNTSRFESLKPEFRQALFDAAKQAGQEFMTSAEQDVARDLDKMQREQGVTYTVLDLKPGIAAMQPVIRKLEADKFIPAGLYDRLQSGK